MKFIHLSDLHLGKRIANYSMLEDQRFILEQIINKAQDHHPDGWFICGDVFDRSVPSEESVELYEWFISECAKIAPVYMIAGNHDSGKRLALFSEPLKNSNIFISGCYSGELEKQRLEINGEIADIYMLPYFSPTEVRLIKDKKITTYQEALKIILEEIELNPEVLNILLSHQFFTSHDSNLDLSLETGNIEEINSSLLENFDYVALGHLHNQHKVGDNHIRYCGTPLKFTLNDKTKYLNVIEISKDNLSLITEELPPLRDVKVIKDYYGNLISQEDICRDYVVINLLDTKVIPNVKASLLKKFPNLLQIQFNFELEELDQPVDLSEITTQTPVELLTQFFESNKRHLSSEEIALAEDIFNNLQEQYS